MNSNRGDEQATRNDFHASLQLQMAELTSIMLQTKQESRVCRESKEARLKKAAEREKLEGDKRASEDTQYKEVHSMLSKVLADQRNQASPVDTLDEDQGNGVEKIVEELRDIRRSQNEGLKSLAREHRQMGKEHLNELRAEMRLSAQSSQRSSRAS